MEQGFQYVLQKLKSITTEPGCYLMKDHEGVVFYVGKAKNLRARLKSYFFGSDTRIFVQYLEQILADIEILVVRNDVEALVLERELIHQYQP
ncbi:MAG TPA: GIY-YIG nuclease family protein, partial [Myxococcota bacterium]|nr:GIY-YIG nuclease family protein [Myxococcota bacterium]